MKVSILQECKLPSPNMHSKFKFKSNLRIKIYDGWVETCRIEVEKVEVEVEKNYVEVEKVEEESDIANPNIFEENSEESATGTKVKEDIPKRDFKRAKKTSAIFSEC